MTGSAVGSFDLVPGAVGVGGARTITDAEIAFLPALMGASSPLFHDAVAARDSAMGTRILYGPAVLGIAVALTEPLLRTRVMGLVEITSVRFRRPVRPGNTIRARFTVRSCVPRDGKEGMLLELDDEVHNEDDELVLSFSRTILVSSE